MGQKCSEWLFTLLWSVKKVESCANPCWSRSDLAWKLTWIRWFQTSAVPAFGVDLWEVWVGDLHAAWARRGRRWRLLFRVLQWGYPRLLQPGMCAADAYPRIKKFSLLNCALFLCPGILWNNKLAPFGALFFFFSCFFFPLNIHNTRISIEIWGRLINMFWCILYTNHVCKSEWLKEFLFLILMRAALNIFLSHLVFCSFQTGRTS